MKRKNVNRGEAEETMEIVWQTPANSPQRQDYIFRDGIRYVKPYYFEFISHAKNRWVGKTIVDLFTEEFKGRPRDYYVSAVKAGRIQVVPVSYIVHSSQKISHFLHRHEPPVMALEVEILFTEPDVLTVRKPASVPIEAGEVKKQYIARVLGVFPENEVESGQNRKSPSKGKTACTKFRRISTNGTNSIVSCEPITGRTHQIRVHLQFTGHPIANDMLCLCLSESVNNRSVEGLGADRGSVMSEFSLKPNHCEICVPNSTDDPIEDFCIDLCIRIVLIWHLKDMMGMKRVYGCTVYDIPGQAGLTSAHILIGLL